MKRRVFKAVLALLALYLAATLWLVIDGLHDRLGHADAALVLGSKVELDGRPSARLRARLDRALELYRAGYFPRVVVSGGVGKEGFDEGAVMRDYLVANGMPAERIIVDSHGDNTLASALNLRAIAEREHITSVMAVSQYFHLPRTRLILHKQGFGTVYTTGPRFFEWRDVYSSLRETAGYVEYGFK